MKVRLVYKSFHAPETLLVQGDIVEGEYAVYLLTTFPMWFEYVEPEKKDVVEPTKDISTIIKRPYKRVK